MATALLVLAIPAVTSAQNYRDRIHDRDQYDRDQYDRIDTRQIQRTISRLDNTSRRLEDDLRYAPARRVLGIFQYRTIDTDAIAEVQDFREAVRQLRSSTDYGAFNRSVDEAQVVLDRGVRLEHYLRGRSNSSRMDADLSDLDSNLRMIANVYGLRMPY